MEHRRIAIIGGGWAGIAAAVELTAAGQSVTLFEAGRQLGGRARGITLAGRRLDNGQHILLGAYREILALMRQLGADPEKLLQRLPLAVEDNAGFRLQLPKIPAPFNLAWGLLTASGVSLREKIATALWMNGLKSRKFQLAADVTVAQWLDAAGQTGALRQHLWAPLCLAALNTPIDNASAQLFANTLRDSLGSPHRKDTDLLLPRVDLGQVLPEPAAQWLTAKGAELRLSHRVKEIGVEIGDRPQFYEPQNCGLSPISVDGEHFDVIILATAPQHAAALLQIDKNFGFEFEPIGTVYLAYPAGTALPVPMLGQQGGIGQWAIDRGDGMIACILSGHGEWESKSDDTLAQILTAELDLPTKPLWHGVVREKRATFACRPNLTRPGAQTVHPQLWLAGDYTWADYPGTLEGAVKSGLRAAHNTLKHDLLQ
ncbi:MAG: FAD-binding protein [Proteobacteria bacterium]|nr:FAD-binding protein [Pseudomonadota bacterium]